MRRIVFLLIAATTATMAHASTIDVPLQAGANFAAANSAAMNSAIAGATAGDVIRIGAGTFTLANPVQLKSNVSVVGVSAKKSTLSATFTRAQSMITGHKLLNVEVSGLTLDGQQNANVNQGIELDKSSGLSIHDLVIMNLVGSNAANAPLGPHAIDCTGGVTKSTFDSITCRSIGVGRTWGGGIRLSWNSIANRISNCVVDNTGRGGIFCNDGSTDNVITGNTVSRSGGVGLGIEVQNCDRSVIERNNIDHWLSVDNSSGSAVRGNMIGTVDGTQKLCGIEIVDSHDVVVTGNAVTGGEQVALSISGPKPKTQLLFANNLFAGASTWAAQIEGDAGGVSQAYFDSNRFIKTRTGPSPLYANQGHGVRLNGNCQSIVFDANEIAHNAGVGVQVTGDNVHDITFFKNSILDNDGNVLDSDPIPHLTWQANHLAVGSNAASWERINENVQPLAGTIGIQGAAASSSDPSSFTADVNQPLGATASLPADFQPTEWLWDFGDSLPATTSTATHLYKRRGVYAVTMIAWDAGGHAARAKTSVTVSSVNADRRR